MKEQKAILAGGCFWGMEDLIRKLPGVLDTEVGYIGGNLENPTYKNVKTGTTNHAEAIEIIFDAEILSYEKLLGFFFQIHDPTTINRQGNDIGTSYRSAIFYLNEEQKNIAQNLIMKIENSKKWPGKIITAIVKADKFYPAENYHQDYLEHYPQGYTCHFIRPSWKLIITFFTFLFFTFNSYAYPVVLELFTSHGCSYCPAADANLKELARENPDIIALSYHVDYWNRRWVDPFSLTESTSRQKSYNSNLGSNKIYTPQIVINGSEIVRQATSKASIETAIKENQKSFALNITLTPNNQNGLVAKIKSNNLAKIKEFDLWEIKFKPYAKTTINSGSNSGLVIENINNVTAIKLIKVVNNFIFSEQITLDNSTNESIVILAQEKNQGKILGATIYKK